MNWRRQSIPETSAMWLVLVEGIAFGIASRSLWWGVAATLVQVAGAWCCFKVVRSMPMTPHAMLKETVERIEGKLDTLGIKTQERWGTR